MKRIAVVGAEHAWPRAVANEIEKASDEGGFTICMKDFFEPGERDFRPLLARLQASRADIAVLMSWPPELDLFARQYHEVNSPIPITSDWAFEASAEPALFNGFWFVSFPSSAASYQARFKERFGYVPYAQMELGDLMVRLAVLAVENAGDGRAVPPLDQIAAALLQVQQSDTAIGPVSFDSSGVLQTRYALKTVRDGKVLEVE